MAVVQEAPLPDFAVEALKADRRRDGRVDYDNPHLVDLLRRREFPTIEDALSEGGVAIDLGPPTRAERSAFLFVILLTACFWAVIAGVLWRTL